MSHLRLASAPEPLSALLNAVPTAASIAPGTEAEALATLGEVALRLEALRSGLVARVLSGATRPAPAPVDLEAELSVEDVARAVGMGIEWVREHATELGGRQRGRRWRFTRRRLVASPLYSGRR